MAKIAFLPNEQRITLQPGEHPGFTGHPFYERKLTGNPLYDHYHSTGMREYDSRCNCCWLNFGHTDLAHVKSIMQHDLGWNGMRILLRLEHMGYSRNERKQLYRECEKTWWKCYAPWPWDEEFSSDIRID